MISGISEYLFGALGGVALGYGVAKLVTPADAPAPTLASYVEAIGSHVYATDTQQIDFGEYVCTAMGQKTFVCVKK